MAEPIALTDRIEKPDGRVYRKLAGGGMRITRPGNLVCDITPASLANRRATLVKRIQAAQAELDWFDQRTQDVAAIQKETLEARK